VTAATNPADDTEPATSPAALPEQPSVSVILPILNEERHLADAVRMVLTQDYPALREVVLALGPSQDRTDEVAAALASEDARVHTVSNPSGRTPDALNAAIAAASGDVIVRVDGHAEIPVDYISTAVRELIRVGADNVGGIMDAQGTTDFERAVARAMRSKIGVGNSAFHTGGEAGESETVYLGVFRRIALERIGGYDPHFTRAQDWEMNHRIRESGGKVWFTPDLKVTYRPRGTIRALAKQYFHYGRWRRVVARHHDGTINLRYLAPPAMVLGTTAAVAVGFFWAPAWLVPAGYVAGVTAGGIAINDGETIRTRAVAPLVLATMHWAWGIGFLSSPRRLAVGCMRGGMPTSE
jgi:GT2 family glycosyltransferase